MERTVHFEHFISETLQVLYITLFQMMVKTKKKIQKNLTTQILMLLVLMKGTIKLR